MNERTRLWDFYISIPKDGENERYARNVQVAVVAIDLDRAIAALRTKYPVCDIWNVSHRGNREVVIDD